MTSKKFQTPPTVRRGISNARVFSGLFAFLITIALLGSSLAHAQLAGKGEIKGSVADSSGAVVPGAIVTATSTTQGTKFTNISSNSGDFDITNLNPDIYRVTVAAKGFQTVNQEDVHVNALEVANLKFNLVVGSETQSIDVSTAPPQLETSNATLGATMENDLYSSLPLEMGAYGNPDQRRATDFAFLMPGVQGNNTNGNPTTNTGIVNGSGSRGAASDVYIDGLPFVRAGGNGDPRYVWTAMSVDAVDQFQVQTTGYSAIYEGQGIQNYTIKQGGTKYHGSLYEFFRNTALDTWGFFGPANINPATGQPSKPVEHSNEYGIDLGGPLIPFGSWREKVFFFGNYSGFKYSSQTPTSLTFPTLAEQQGNFQALTKVGSSSNTTLGIYDPSTQASCTAHSTDGPCRYEYGYGPGTANGSRGNPVATGAPIDVIPASQFSQVAKNLQGFIPALTNQNATGNYIAPNATGLSNWSTTDRIDYTITKKDTLTMVAAIGRQASSNPVGQTTAGRNVGPIPYNYGQTYAPKTAVGVIEESHVFTPNVVNQFKYGYARYNGPTFNANQVPQYSATAMGLTGLPSGPAQLSFPIVTWAGTNAPTNWGGTTPNITLAENYTVLDNLQWVHGNHSFTFGGQVAWLLYNTVSATGGSTPITLATAVTESAAINKSSNSAPAYAATANTGLSYASFLVGQIDKGSFTQYLQQEFGARFRAISPYVQDNWRVNSKLTLDLGLRYDFYPSVTEVHNAQSFFSPTLANPITGINGALQYAGHGTGTCNCATPVNNYFKNFGPRVGVAYQLDPKTVLRASYGVMFTHGNAVGGLATSLGVLGFSAAPSFSANGQLLSTMPLTGSNGAIPAYTGASGIASGPNFGTGYTTTAGYTGTPSSMGYADPYLGGRAPEYINWSFGFQHQWTNAFTSSISYVGSQGHFLQADGTNARGYWANQLDPKYLSLGSNLNLTGSALTAFCAANSGVCPSYTNIFNTGQSLATLLKPFPFQGVSDSFGYVANASYNSLQASFNMRASHGLTFMANYTWSRTIDNGGTFRSGYAIPAAFSGSGKAFAQDAIERSVSTSNQPQHVVITGVWDMPFGRSILNGSSWERAVFGGFKFSEIFQAFSGSPLYITEASSNPNPAAAVNLPSLNPAFSGPARINGKWGQGVTAANYSSTTNPANQFINNSAFVTNTAYQFGNSPRTAPYNIYGPGNYDLDLGINRSFPLHFTESARFNFRADWYNITNHTWFAVASTAWGNANFGQVAPNTTAPRKSAQLSARIDF
jgi:Carboxypeptidase regulatory-like domain